MAVFKRINLFKLAFILDELIKKRKCQANESTLAAID